MRTPRPIAIAIAAIAALAGATAAITQAPADAGGHLGLSLMLRKLATTGTVLHATAHPDDENNALLAMQSHGQGLRVVLASATRGNGGQNEIGPELFETLGVLRTEELFAAHRFDGAEQFFARAVDFGYSFSIEETFEKWGREEIVSDYVRLIRLTRPDVILTMRPYGPGGGQHHQASALLAIDAFNAAADPTRFPEQIRGGLRPWRAAKAYQMARYGNEPQPSPGAQLVRVETDVYDPVLGRTYTEIGSQARSMHKSQGFGQLLALPGSFAPAYQRVDARGSAAGRGSEASLLDGLNLSIPGLAARFGGTAPPLPLIAALDAIASAVTTAGERLRSGGPSAAVAPLAGGLKAVRGLRQQLPTMRFADEGRWEIDFRLSQTEALFERALILGQGLRLEALADDGVVTPGQAVKVTVIAANRGADAFQLTELAAEGLEGDLSGCRTGSLASGGVMRCEPELRIPLNARVTEPYWHRVGDAGRYTFEDDAPFGLPFRPTPFGVRMRMTVGDVPVRVLLPVLYRYEGNIFSGEKRMELSVVPSVTARVTPEIVVVPTDDRVSPTATTFARFVRVTVTSNLPHAAEGEVRLTVPNGWTAEPRTARVQLSRADESVTLPFSLTPPRPARPGTYQITALVEADRQTFDRGFQVIEYPHTRRRHMFQAASTRVAVIDVSVPPDLEVGYVMGVGDQVPPAIEQIGAEVGMLGPDDLAWGDLSRFDAIVTGVRAYERRGDLRAHNHRLLQYAQQGGTVIVQYNKLEFNQAQYGPYPAKVGTGRVTDENSPVVLLEPGHPVFTVPNRIGPSAWQGWAQERGLYFLGDRDPRYVDLLELADPFELNAGPKHGALVEARVGRGRWIYVGLGLWRQLPAGTAGAYQLLANLISLGRTAPVK